jgi:hypothetical protein
LNKPTRGFVLILVGGAMNMIFSGIYNPFVFRASFYTLYYSDPTSIGLVIIALGILLYEMPARNVSFAAAVIAISAAQLLSSIIVVASFGGIFYNVFSIVPYVPLTGSIISILGGASAVRWKPKN